METKPIVVLIHGMGSHPSGQITKDFKKGLSESAEFLKISEFDPDKEFEFEEFNYSEYFDKKRQELGDEAEAITDYLAATPSFFQRLISFQAKLNDDGFLYTHWLDVVFYCLFGTLRETIISRCMEVLLTVLKKAKDDPDNERLVIFVGHSLGTALLHDSLTKLYLRRSEPDVEGKIRFSNYPIDGLLTIANVSRLTHLLTRLEDPESSIVRDDNQQNDGVAHLFYPVYNQYDPFTIFKRYAVDPQVGDLIRTNEIRELSGNDIPVNPHSLVEYLADPEVGSVFISEFSSHSVTASQIRTAKTEYKKGTISGPISYKFKAVEQAIKDLEHEANQGANLIKLVRLSMELFELVQAAYELLKNTKAKQ